MRFRLEAANVEQNNIKGDKRFFIPLVEKTDWDAAARMVTVPFEYRLLTEEEGARYGKQKQQDKIIADAVDEVPLRVHDALGAVEALTGEHRLSGNDEPSAAWSTICGSTPGATIRTSSFTRICAGSSRGS